MLQQIESLGTDRVRLEFRMPSRGLFGYRNQFLTDTHGEGIINQIFDGYDVWAGMIANRSTGSLVSFETGDAVTYGLYNAQQRGTLLIGAGEKVYEGMVIGYTASGEDVDVNVCKTKHLTNTRSSGSDDALRLIPVSKLSLEGCLEFLAQDELLEVTPENLRIRKQILNHDQRMKAKSKLKYHLYSRRSALVPVPPQSRRSNRWNPQSVRQFLAAGAFSGVPVTPSVKACRLCQLPQGGRLQRKIDFRIFAKKACKSAVTAV